MNTDAASIKFIQNRYLIERFTREFFYSLDYLETRTPLLVRSPGMEPHLRPMILKNKASDHLSDSRFTFLPTSPEFAMKKLLGMGLPKIFQICSSFRDEPTSPDHHPEFSMLEFYESNISLDHFQNRVEDLFRYLANRLYAKDQVQFRGESISLQGPWPRYRIVDLFEKNVGIDLRLHQDSESLSRVCKENSILAEKNEPWDDLYFKLWLNLIEPKLPKNELFFVTHYPTSQSSLCNRVKDEEGFTWANRFEVYLGNFELGNAFDELRDPVLQRKNFEHDQQIRREIYQDQMPESPIDEELLMAIEKMAPTSGIALGFDRICMLMLNASSIDQVIPLKSYWPET